MSENGEIYTAGKNFTLPPSDGSRGRRSVLKIHFFIESDIKMIQFKTKSKIFIQKNIHPEYIQKNYSLKKNQQFSTILLTLDLVRWSKWPQCPKNGQKKANLALIKTKNLILGRYFQKHKCSVSSFISNRYWNPKYSFKTNIYFSNPEYSFFKRGRIAYS